MTPLIDTAGMPLVIVERDGRWAAALRLALSETAGEGSNLLDALRLVELRSLDELHAALRESPSATVCLELKPPAESAVAALIDIQRQFPDVVAFVVADRRHAAYSGVIREAGAVAYIDSPRRLMAICPLIRRRFEQWRRRSVPSALDIASRLPWSDVDGDEE